MSLGSLWGFGENGDKEPSGEENGNCVRTKAIQNKWRATPCDYLNPFICKNGEP